MPGIGSVARVAGQLLRFGAGYGAFLASGRTPQFGYTAMRNLYCATDGRWNDAMGRMLSLVRPPYRLRETRGVLGDMRGGELGRRLEELHRVGFVQFEQRLPQAECDELRRFALETPCRPYPPAPGLPESGRYDPATWGAPKYEYDEAVLLSNPAVQRLAGDPSVLALAQAYLGARPVLDLAAMWWSTSFSDRPSSEIAQLFHFDMDRLNFIKFFVYLSDVGPENGPHCYVAGSVKRKPRSVLRDERIDDDEVARLYRPEAVREIQGPCGTIFAADTRGLHKGTPLESGDRLLLQLEFASSLFGQQYGTIRLEPPVDPALAEAARRYPATYRRFHLRPR